MTNSPLVSFCMSTFKRPVILARQLREILKQNYSNLEIVVSDNDPEASAKEVAESIGDPRVRYFNNGTNLGMVKSFNQSVARSSGEYIIMITDDDPVYPELVKTLVDLRNRYPGFGVYAGCADWIVETEFSAGSLKEKIGANSTVLRDLANDAVLEIAGTDFVEAYTNGKLNKTFILWSCCLVESSIVREVGGMPDYGSELLTDHAFIMACASEKGMLFINKALGGQSVRGDNFGYDFEKNLQKYLSTPRAFYNFLQTHLPSNASSAQTERRLWDFIGRAWVEYSLMIYRSLKIKKESTKNFFASFRQVFSDPELRKWKLKFYLKAYFSPLFRVLVKLKGN
jgi:glycosyltransferase involved in cell wall biosynthesis